MADLQAIIEEVAAVYDTKTLHKLYRIATEQAYSFLYVKLTAKDVDDMFYMRFDKKLIPNGQERTQYHNLKRIFASLNIYLKCWQVTEVL